MISEVCTSQNLITGGNLICRFNWSQVESNETTSLFTVLLSDRLNRRHIEGSRAKDRDYRQSNTSVQLVASHVPLGTALDRCI